MYAKYKNIVRLISFLLVSVMLLAAVGCSKEMDGYGYSESSSESGYGAYGDTSEKNDATSKKETTKKETSKNNSTSKETSAPKRTFKTNVTNKWKYYKDMENGIVERTITINTGWGGESVNLVQMTDMHINYCNENDLKDPVLNSTYKNRTWLKNGESLPNIARCMEASKDADLIVLTGDIYDYYSEGVVEKANDYIFEKYNNVVGAIGNHEPIRKVQGTVPETKSYDELRRLVSDSWCNDIAYDSYVLKNKVMIILLDNSSDHFRQEQINFLKGDLNKARANGYVVLLFYHIPLNTGVPSDKNAKSSYQNDGEYANFYDYEYHVGPASTGVDKTIYDLICSNGDIIKGTFCGHYHSDFYTEIQATTPNGTKTMIPQYILTGVAYDKGHLLRITIN